MCQDRFGTVTAEPFKQDVPKTARLTRPTPARQDAPLPVLRSHLESILNAPHRDRIALAIRGGGSEVTPAVLSSAAALLTAFWIILRGAGFQFPPEINYATNQTTSYRFQPARDFYHWNRYGCRENACRICARDVSESGGDRCWCHEAD